MSDGNTQAMESAKEGSLLQSQTAAEREAVEASMHDGVATRLRQWLMDNNEHNEAASDVALDTNLLDEGVLDSLEMVNFIMFIEDLRGHEIPESLMQPEYFTSVRVIRDTFFD